MTEERLTADTAAVLLVGASAYQHLPPLPSVQRNLDALRGVFESPTFWGVPGDRVHVLSNPRSAVDVLSSLDMLGKVASGLLLVYYGGHGVVEEDGSLVLSLPDTERGKTYTGLRFSDVQRILRTSGARRRVAILDCCYSGRGISRAMSASPITDGALTFAASPANSAATAPEGARFTAFTGALIETLQGGLPGEGHLLSINQVARHVTTLLVSRGLPVPQVQDLNFVGDLGWVRNVQSAAPALPDAEPAAASPASNRAYWSRNALLEVLHKHADDVGLLMGGKIPDEKATRIRTRFGISEQTEILAYSNFSKPSFRLKNDGTSPFFKFTTGELCLTEATFLYRARPLLFVHQFRMDYSQLPRFRIFGDEESHTAANGHVHRLGYIRFREEGGQKEDLETLGYWFASSVAALLSEIGSLRP